MAWRGWARLGRAGPGEAWHGFFLKWIHFKHIIIQVLARPGEARRGKAWRGWAWRGKAWFFLVMNFISLHGTAGLGMARRGKAWFFLVRYAHHMTIQKSR